jgi:hypothetical protein
MFSILLKSLKNQGWLKLPDARRYEKLMGNLVTKHAEYSLISSLHRPRLKTKTSRTAFICYNRGFIFTGGESGIRTPEGLTSLTVFKTAAFNHSANSPFHISLQKRLQE